MSAQVRDWREAVSLFLGYSVLAVVWMAVWHQFFGAMAPRLSHMGAGGLKISDWPCGCPQCDFSGFWPAGILARAGAAGRAYDPAWFLAYRHAVFSDQAELVRWFYPPPAFLPVMAVSFVPFEAGFWVWTVALTGIAILLLWRARLPWGVIAVGMLSPAALWNMELGQFGTITGAMVVAALLLAKDAPVVAGSALGWLVIKPQAGLLVGVAMLGRRFWRALGVAVGVAIGLAALVTVLAGRGVWGAYLGEGLAVSKTVLLALPPAAGYEKFGVSVFWALRVLGAGAGVAYAAQGLAAVVSAGVVFWVWRRGWGNACSRMAVTVFCSLLATPYGYTDDMVGYSVALAALAAGRGWRIDVLDALLFLWPALCPVVFMRTGVLLTPLVVVVAVTRVFWRGRHAVVIGG